MSTSHCLLKIKQIALTFVSFSFFISCGYKSIDYDKNLGSSLAARSIDYYCGVFEKEHAKEVNFSFDIYNKSDSILKIEGIDVSCGCLSVRSYPTLLTPDSLYQINGTINLAGQKGHVNKCIFVNYSKDEVYLLRVVADIK